MLANEVNFFGLEVQVYQSLCPVILHSSKL